MTTEQVENALGGHCAHRYVRAEFGKNVAVCADCGADVENAKVSFRGSISGGYTWGYVASLHTEQAGAVLPRPTTADYKTIVAWQAWQDERASILKTKREQIDSMQVELTRLREENRVLREGLEDIGKRGVEPFTTSQWLFYSRDVALKTLAAADKIRGGV